ncbi:MAG: type 4 prepilin peptidase 1, Aspartic peptidase family [Candidatus Binatus sp.]|nr:type 4 prepilin peptidase 1, Aspartic peptidase family [Candidatus Binatus sp.]
MTVDLPTGIGAALAFLLGACVGSFVNVVAWRLPREVSIATPRSYCESCERALPWWANIPILAYLGLRGRCVMCGAPLPFRHFLAEIGLAVTALYLYLAFPLGDAFARFVLCAALWIVAIIDYDWRLIPNIITWPGMLVGFVFASLLMPEVGWKSSALGILIGGGVLLGTGYLYQLVRGREGVGLGDVWLLGMVGGFLGFPGVAFTLFVGSVIGAFGGIAYALGGSPSPAPLSDPAADPTEADVSILRTEVPFGPFLALAAGIYALFQPQLTHWYLSR